MTADPWILHRLMETLVVAGLIFLSLLLVTVWLLRDEPRSCPLCHGEPRADGDQCEICGGRGTL